MGSCSTYNQRVYITHIARKLPLAQVIDRYVQLLAFKQLGCYFSFGTSLTKDILFDQKKIKL